MAGARMKRRVFLSLAVVAVLAILAEMLLSICGVVMVDPVVVAITVLWLCAMQSCWKHCDKVVKGK